MTFSPLGLISPRFNNIYEAFDVLKHSDGEGRMNKNGSCPPGQQRETQKQPGNWQGRLSAVADHRE